MGSTIEEQRGNPSADAVACDGHRFVFETLEPRLLLSADLSPLAAHALDQALAQIDQNLLDLGKTGGLSVTAPMVSRSLADLAALGDPVGQLQSAQTAYFASTAAPTLEGLASWLNSHVAQLGNSATAQVTGAVDTISLHWADQTSQTANQIFDLSGSVVSVNLVPGAQHTVSESFTRSLSLSFGVDTGTNTSVLGAEDARAHLALQTGSLTGALNWGGVATTVTAGTGTLTADLDAAFDAKGALTTTVTGSSSLSLSVTGAGVSGETETITWTAPFTKGAETITYAANSQLLAQVDPLLAEIHAAFSDLRTMIGNAQSVVDGAAVLGSQLPFVGGNLSTAKLFADALAKLGDLEQTLTHDLSAPNSLLSALKADIQQAFSAFQSDTVDLYYLDAGSNAVHYAGGNVALSAIKGLEFDVVLGGSWKTSNNIGFDFGLPGLGLTTQNANVEGTVGWTLDFGLGVTADNAYAVLGNKTNGGNALTLTLDFALAPGFTAIGRMGLFDVLLTERLDKATKQPITGADTGVSGGIGLAFDVAGSGTAMNGGVELTPATLANLASASVKPNFTIKAHSNLQAAFGFSFQQDPTTKLWTDASDFPSLAADIGFDWTMSGTPDQVKTETPSFALDDIRLDFGQFVTKFLKDLFQPIAPLLEPLAKIADFASGNVPVVSSLLKETVSALGHAGLTALQNTAFYSYTGGDYTWVNFYLDQKAREDGTAPSPGDVKGQQALQDQAKLILSIFAAVKKLSDLANQVNSYSGDFTISLGNFDFGGKDLRLPRGLDPNALPDFANLSPADLAGTVDGLFGTSLGKTLQDVEATVNQYAPGLAGDLFGDVAAAAGLSDNNGFHYKYAFPILDDPSSILTMLFGRDANLAEIDLWAHYGDHQVIPLFGFDFIIADLAVVLDYSYNFNFGLSLGYDTRGVREFFAGGAKDAGLIADGFYLGSFDPTGKVANPPIISVDANIFVGGDVGILTLDVILEGGVGASATLSLSDSDQNATANPGPNDLSNRIHLLNLIGAFKGNPISGFPDSGMIGPFYVQGSAWAQARLIEKVGVDPFSYTHEDDLTPATEFFHFPAHNTPKEQRYPLGFFHASTGELDLYQGALAMRRFFDPTHQNADGSFGAYDYQDGTGYETSPQPYQSSYYNDPFDETYIVDLNADGTVTIHFLIGPKNVAQIVNGPTEITQTFTADVSSIVTNAQQGNDTVIVNNFTGHAVTVVARGDGKTPVGSNLGGTVYRPGKDDFELHGLGVVQFTGGNDDDRLVAGQGNATMLGGDGNDTLLANSGAEYLDGGAGTDLISFEQLQAGVSIDLSKGTGSGPWATYQFAGLENVLGSAHDDVLIGDDGANRIDAGGGNDVIFGLGGNDTLNGGNGAALIDGGAGDDVVTGGALASTLSGGDGNDVIVGVSGADTIYGNDGADLIHAATGVGNHIEGGAGNDSIYGGNGADSIWGNDGNDVIVGGSGGSWIDGGTGDDNILGGGGADTIFGNTGNDTILAAGGNDLIDAGDGANLVDGGAGNDTILAGSGADTITGGSGDDSIFAGGGNDTIDGGAGNDTILGGDGNDTILGGAGNDSLDGGAGDDLLIGAEGNDTILGGTGNDTLLGGDGADSIDGGAGNDSIDGGNGNDTIYGGDGNDVVYGGAGDDWIDAGAGNDLVDGGDGNDTIFGNTGADTIYGGAGDDSIDGGDGNDVLYGGAGSNTILGGAGDDVIWGGSGNASIDGGDGNDTIYGAEGADTIHGGAGDDVIRAQGAADLVYGDAGNDLIYGSDRASAGPVDFVAGPFAFEALSGGDGNDTIYGGAAPAVILGDGGGDVIVAGSGATIASGGAGDDTITGGLGEASLFGGDGRDVITAGSGNTSIWGDNGGVALAFLASGLLMKTAQPVGPQTGGDANSDTLTGGAGSDVLWGEEGNDLLTGGAGAATLYGGSGEDILHGGSGIGALLDGGDGADVLIGSDGGWNTLLGGAGADRIEMRGGHNAADGGAGDDVLIGGQGNDVLSGGLGADTLIGNAPSDLLYGFAADPKGSDNAVDLLLPTAGVVGDDLSSPATVAPTAAVTLPHDGVPAGYWSLVAGTPGLSLADASAGSPAVAADANGPYVAWTQTIAGASGLYVAHFVGGQWTAVGTAATGTGLAAAGTTASSPSLCLDATGRLIAAWTEASASGTTVRIAAFDAPSGHWVGLGGSLVGGGIAGFGAADDARVLATAGGPVVVWRDASGGAAHLKALRFDGAAWVELGAGSATTGLAGSLGAPADFAVTTDGSSIAVAFVAPGGLALNVAEWTAGTWVTRVGPVVTTGTAADTISAPTAAYYGGSLHLAWIQRDAGTGWAPALYAVRENGGAWMSDGVGAGSGLGLATTDAALAAPTLSASASGLELVWAGNPTGAGGDFALRAMKWTGTAFAATLPSDVVSRGVGDLGAVPDALAMAVDPSGRAWLASRVSGQTTGFSLRAGGSSAAHVFIADATHSIASILAGGQITAGDLLLVVATPSDTALTLDASAAGITLAGIDGATLASSVTIAGATGLTLRDLTISGGVSVSSTDRVSLVGNHFQAGVTLSGATHLSVRDDAFLAPTGNNLRIAAASGGEIRANVFRGAGTGLWVGATFDGSITGNDIASGGVGIDYEAKAGIFGNRIHDSLFAVTTTVVDPSAVFGWAGGNDLVGNATGVKLLSGAGIVNQRIVGNGVGVIGLGTIGGADTSQANVIERNGVGIQLFFGVVQNNRIDRNSNGIEATTGLSIFGNEIVGNVQVGISAVGVHQVTIAGNTIRAFVGDAVRLSGGSYDVELVSNIVWADSGYAIWVANDSQTGFWSDYNTLHAQGSGRLVYWTRDFGDILDWQDDVGLFDLHSTGTTVVHPTWAEPYFDLDGHGFLVARPEVAGVRATNPGASGGDPFGSFVGWSGVPNQLANPGFETDLAGWSGTAGTSSSAAGPTAWAGSNVLLSGTAANSLTQQSVDLVAAGLKIADIDAGAVQIGFGGRVALLAAKAQANISVVFRDADGATIGNPLIVQATASDLTRWQRVFSSNWVPQGARTVQFTFAAIGANGAALDQAFLGFVTRGVGFDRGVKSSSPSVFGDAGIGRIDLRSPDLYTNWDLDTPRFITWDTYGAAAGQPVRIELWQDGPNGPSLRSVIAASTPDTGRFAWTPSASGLSHGDHGLRIRIVGLGGARSIADMSTEAFAVPESGTTYWVAADGSNRNTGKMATSPLPNPVNLFRSYDVGAGSVVDIAAGDYPLLTPLTLSGVTDLGFGLDSGFTVNGPIDPAQVARLFPANPVTPPPAAMIGIHGAGFVSLNHLTLQGGVTALTVDGGSDSFSASWLTAIGQSGDAFDITSNSPSGILDHLTSINPGGMGLSLSGAFGTISHFSSTGGTYGIGMESGSIGRIIDSTLSGASQYGLHLYLTGPTTFEGDTLSGNAVAGWIGGNGVVFGNADLSKARGNIVTGNSGGLTLSGNDTVVGNTFSFNKNRNAVALSTQGTTDIVDNAVFGNWDGVRINGGSGVVRGNRIYGNSDVGLSTTQDKATVDQNVFYSNGVSVEAHGGNGSTFTGNVIYGDAIAGLRLSASINSTVIGNTFYEPMAGTLPDPNGSGAIVLAGASTGTTLGDDIVVALAGVALRIADAAQAGLVSDYNLFNTGAGGRIGNWLGTDYANLSAWRAATGRDGRSRTADPLFVSPTGVDGVLGWSGSATSGNDDDFHVKSTQGSFHGGSLSVIVDGASGLPVFPTATLVKDGVDSPAIDRGNPAMSVGAEPAPNGNLVEIGAYGGTAQASLSAPRFLAMVTPDGGETLTEGTTTTLRWNSFGVTGTVDIAVTADGVHLTTLATGVANTGSWAWTVDPAVFAVGTTYRVQVSATADPSIKGMSEAPFTIAAPVSTYWINDGSTAGDQYTTAIGNDANSGTSPDAPMATLAALMAKYAVGAGTTIYVDTGTYALTNNLVLKAPVSGSGDLASQRLVIQGPTAAGAAATFNRQSTSNGFYDFEFAGAKNVTLANLRFTGAAWGVYLDDNAASTGITFSNDVFERNTNGLYVGTADDNALVTGSIFTNMTGYGMEIGAAAGARVIGSTFDMETAGGWQTALYITGAASPVVSNDTFTMAGYAPTSINVASTTNLTIQNVTTNGGYYGIIVSGTSGLIAGNTVDAKGGAFGIQGNDTNTGTLKILGNTISDETGGNSSEAALTVGQNGYASGNIISASNIGIRMRANGVAENNRVFGSGIGILVDGSYTTVRANKVYDNNQGIVIDSYSSLIDNNFVYDNKIGLQLGLYSGYSTYGRNEIIDNTFVQTSGQAVLRNTGAAASDLRNNVFSLTNAVGYTVGAATQAGFVSDYNLFDLGAGGILANWGGVGFTDLSTWKATIGFDRNSIAGNPKFVAPSGADGKRGWVGGVDYGADDDFTLASGSAAIDRGDPSSPFQIEPAGNGARSDIGATGNAVTALPGSAQTVQILGSTGGERYQVGQATTISIRSDGLVSQEPVFFMGAGVSSVTSGSESWNAWQSGILYETGLPASNYAAWQSKTATPVGANGLDIPQAVLQSYIYANAHLGYQIPLQDGTYTATLIFAETQGYSAGGRAFSISANGQTIRSSYDIVASAGAANTATTVSFAFNATGGTGLALSLDALKGYPTLTGIAITRAVAPAAAYSVALQVSTDAGKTWSTIADNVQLDAFGAAQVAWTPDTPTAGYGGLLRVVATNGANTVSDTSVAPFMVAPGGHDYYVNDGSTVGDGYTTAVGNDLNSGKTADAPMASLASLLKAYRLRPGDNVYVDAGNYVLPTQIVLDGTIGGTPANPIHIYGAANGQTVLTRNSVASGTSVISFAGAHDVILSNLALVGGFSSVDFAVGAVNTGITLDHLDVSGFGTNGINIVAGNGAVTVSNSIFHAPTNAYSYGIAVATANGVVLTGNTMTGLGYGIYVSDGLQITVSNNSISKFATGASYGIYVQMQNSGALPVPKATVTGNTVVGNGANGVVAIYVNTTQAGSVIGGNTSSNASKGIFAYGAMSVDGNTLFGNGIGLDMTGSVSATNNSIHDNTTYGISVSSSTNELVQGNTFTNNAAAISGSGTFTVTNNLMIGNGVALDNWNTAFVTFANNTVVQASGTVIRLRHTGSTATVKNNVFSLSGGAVYDVSVAEIQSLSADWNLYSLTGTATIGAWGNSTVADFATWRWGTGMDAHGFAADPQFQNTAAGNYLLSPTSPGIDAGNPLSAWGGEPGNNGGRVNLGYEGNTALATQSTAETVQVTSPNGLDKLQQGVATTVTFRTSGISGYALVSETNFGGADIPGTLWTGSSQNYGTVSASAPIDTSGIASAPPAQVFASSVQAYYYAGSTIVEKAAVADGTYLVRLYFAEYTANYKHPFDIAINGATVASNFEISTAAGGQINKGVVQSFTVDATGGAGITVTLTNKSFNQATLAGIEIDRVVPSTAQGKTAKVEASPDGGTTWETIAIAVPLALDGTGSVTWTPDFQTNGNTGLVRVTVDGVSDVSDRPFLVTNSGHDYYVNDGSTVGDEYTSAVGNDFNSGKTADAPMASVAALVRAYGLGAGDVVHIDTGTYGLLSEVVLGSGDSGAANVDGQRVVFQGPTRAGDVATLDLAGGPGAVFHLLGGSNIEIDDLALTNANAGVKAEANSNNLTLHRDVISKVATYGVDVEYGSTGALIDSSKIFSTYANVTNYGINLAGSGVVTRNEVYGFANGIQATSGLTSTVDANLVHDNVNYGIYAQQNGGAAGQVLTISNNKVYANVVGATSYSNWAGIYAQGYNSPVVVTGNRVFNQSAKYAYGIYASNATVSLNDVWGNWDGIFVANTDTIQYNRIFENADVGLFSTNGTGVVLANRIYSNGTGVRWSDYGTYSLSLDFENNLVYANASAGVALSTTRANLYNDTIWQSAGTALAISGGSVVAARNDILWSDLGSIVTVAADSTATTTLGNDLYWRGVSGNASVATWGAATYQTLAAWVLAVPTRNAGGIEGDPKFISVAGADNLLGGFDVALGGGADDDFTPGRFSPAIDAADGSVGPKTDFFGLGRHDDPAVVNSGVGTPPADIGAIEFQGASSDVTPPAFVAGTDLPADGTTTDAVFTSIGLSFNEPLDAASALSAANYQLVEAGADGKFDTPDDKVVTLSPSYVFPAQSLKLTLADGPLANGHYRLTVSGSGGILDTAGNALDGDGDGAAGGAFVRSFTIDRSADHAPSAQGQALSVPAGQSLAVTLTAPDVDGDAVTFAIVVAPKHGQIQNFDAAAGTFTYVADSGWTGSDLIRFSATDTKLAATSADLTIAVTTVNQKPVAAAQSVAAIAATPTTITLTGYDVETPAGQMSLVIVDGPLHGQLTVTGQNTVSYVAAAGYTGADSFRFAWRDGGLPTGSGVGALQSDPATVSIAVTAISHAPQTSSANVATAVGTPHVFTVADFPFVDPGDLPANHLAAVVVASLPVQGALTLAGAAVGVGQAITVADIAAGRFVYTPDVGSGSPYASFGFRVKDDGGTALGGADTSAVAAMSITVVVPDHAPVTTDASVSMEAGTSHVFRLADFPFSDPNDAPAGKFAAVVLVSEPGLGTLTLAGASTTMGQVISSADIAAGRLVYTPGAGSGALYASFGFRVKDDGGTAFGGADTSGTATMSLVVTATNHAPTTADGAVATNAGSPYAFKVSDFPFADPNDTPANALAAVIVASLPGQGALTLSGAAVGVGQAIAVADIAAGRLVYTPGVGGGAPYASFGFRVRDDGGTAFGAIDTSTPATMAITVRLAAPEAKDDTLSVGRSAAFDATALLANDTTGDPTGLALVDVVAPTHGSVAYDPTTHVVTFVAETGFEGKAGFDYDVAAGPGGLTARAHVTLNLAASPATTPVVGTLHVASGADQSYVFGFDQLIAVASDPSGSALTIGSFDTVKNGVVVLDQIARTVTFTPKAGFVGDGSFRFAVTNGANYGFGVAVVRVGAPKLSAAPVAKDDTVTFALGFPSTISVNTLLANDTDKDAVVPIVTSIANATGGVAGFDAVKGVIAFTPSGAGVGGFDYTISDGVKSSTAHVTVNVTQPNRAPIVIADRVTTKENTAVSISLASLLANDVDLDKDSLSFVDITSVSRGNFVIDRTNGVVLFTPTENFFGRASFTYRVSDGRSIGTGTVYVMVDRVDLAPIVVGETLTDTQGQSLKIAPSTLLLNDSDPNRMPLSVIAVGGAVNATVALSADGKTITFSPLAGFVGTAGFDYTVGNGALTSTAHVDVAVVAPPKATQPMPDAFVGVENTTLTITAQKLLANDVAAPGRTLTITGVSSSINGTVSWDPVKKIVTFVPTADFNDSNGSAGFTYTVTDGLVSRSTTVAIDILARVVAPTVQAPTFEILGGTPLVISVASLVAQGQSHSGSALQLDGVSAGSGGTVVLDQQAGTVTFIPLAGFSGLANFGFTLGDGVSSARATATIKVHQLAVADSIATVKNAPIVVSTAALTANDHDNPALPIPAVTAVGDAVHGTVVLDAQTGLVTFTPDKNFTGTASFTYTLGTGPFSSTAKVTVAVTATVPAVQIVVAPVTLNLTAINGSVSFDGAALLGNAWVSNGGPASLLGVLGSGNGRIGFDPTTGKVHIDLLQPTPAFFTVTFSVISGGRTVIGTAHVKLASATVERGVGVPVEVDPSVEVTRSADTENTPDLRDGPAEVAVTGEMSGPKADTPSLPPSVPTGQLTRMAGERPSDAHLEAALLMGGLILSAPRALGQAPRADRLPLLRRLGHVEIFDPLGDCFTSVDDRIDALEDAPSLPDDIEWPGEQTHQTAAE